MRITCDAEYVSVMKRIDALWNAPEGTPEVEELHMLVLAAEAYEEVTWVTPPAALAAAERNRQR